MADLSFREAVELARPRMEMQWTALCDQMTAWWRDLEPFLRDFVAAGDTLTENDWLDVPEDTRRQYDTWRVFFAEHDARKAH